MFSAHGEQVDVRNLHGAALGVAIVIGERLVLFVELLVSVDHEAGGELALEAREDEASVRVTGRLLGKVQALHGAVECGERKAQNFARECQAGVVALLAQKEDTRCDRR